MTSRTSRPLLLLLLLALSCAAVGAVAAQHRCIFDRSMRRTGPLPVAAVRAAPGAEAVEAEAEPAWAAIRIRVFSEDVQNPEKYCTQSRDRRPNFVGGMVSCGAADVLTDSKRNILLNTLIPGAVQLHAERLLVKPFAGAIVVPSLSSSTICSQFTVPESHGEDGVDDADMVLYAATGPTEIGVLAWAVTCAALPEGRPVIGVTNFDPASMDASRYSIRVFAHEIAHALGFNIEQMQAAKMVSSLTVRGKKRIQVVKSDKTKEKAREHYGCQSANGMELEDEGGEGTARSHWERRNAKDELMAGISGIGYYTALTMAAFEDMKYYRANWGKEESMEWGRNAGCSLLTGPCVSNGSTSFPDMFCTEDTGDKLQCTSDRMELGYCPITKYTKPLPVAYRYFADNSTSGDVDHLTDFCPFIMRYQNTGCTRGDPTKMPGSRITRTSRCLKGNDLFVEGVSIGDVCAEVQCRKGTVSVRYQGDEEWHLCAPGATITPKGDTFTSGTIVCPEYSQVCASM